MENEIKISQKDFKDLKKEYQLAEKNKKSVFIWKEREILTSYAKYLIDYLKTFE